MEKCGIFMANKLIIHRALLIERTNYCVDCSWKVGWGEKKKKITGRNYPRWFLWARRKQGGGCTQNNTLCDSVEMREREEEEKGRGDRGRSRLRDLGRNVARRWWVMTDCWPRESRGEGPWIFEHLGQVEGGVDAELWNFHSMNACTPVENIQPTLQRTKYPIRSFLSFFPSVFLIFFACNG